jgi:hypothetical protein
MTQTHSIHYYKKDTYKKIKILALKSTWIMKRKNLIIYQTFNL